MAMAAAVEPGIEPNELECPVCHELYTEPKILPCAHILCHHCLVSWLQANEDAQCPLCRSEISDIYEHSAETCEDIAEFLPTDLSMVELVEDMQILNKEHVCCACLDVSAVTMCLNCNDMLCRPCATAHGRLTATRHHQVEDLTSLTAERLAYSRPTPCQDHSEKTSELFCPSHGATICHLCAVSKHRACPEVTELELKVEQLRSELDGLVSLLQTREAEIKRAITQLDEELAQTEKRTHAAVKEIDEACDRLQKSVEACRARLRELVNCTSEDRKAIVKERKHSLSQSLGKVTSHRCLVQRIRKTARCQTLHKMMDNLKSRVLGLPSQGDVRNLAKVVTPTTLTINKMDLARLEDDLSQLGDMTVPAAVVTEQPNILRFHVNHGMNIVLVDDRTSAERTDGHMSGTVVLDTPMIIDQLYEVCIIDRKRSRTFTSYVRPGVTFEEPTGRFPPKDPFGWDSAILIGNTYVSEYGKKRDSPVGVALSEMNVGSRVGLLVDCSNALHLFIDQEYQGVAASNVVLPCYAFFELLGTCKKVTALPLSLTPPVYCHGLPLPFSTTWSSQDE